MRRTLLPLLASLAVACAADEPGEGTAGDTATDVDTEGTLSVSLAIIDDIAASMDEAPTGIFYGGIYIEDHVTPTGTTEDAVALETFEVTVQLDPEGSRTEPLYETGPLPAGLVYIIGFLDSDASVGDVVDADQGDPVTMPGFDDRYEVVGGSSSPAEITLDLLLP